MPVPLPRLFDYLPAPGHEQADPATWAGCRVRVPFGRRELVAVITGGQARASVPDAQGARTPGLKPALALIDEQPLLTGELWRSLRWAAAYYHHPLGEVLHAALPALPAKLFHCLKYLFHITRIQPQNTAFQHKGIPGITQIANLAQPVNILIGIYFKDWPIGCIGNSEIDDFKICWAGITPHILSRPGNRSGNIVRFGHKCKAQTSKGSFIKKISSAVSFVI